MKRILSNILLAGALALLALPARAQEITLKAVSAFNDGTAFSRPFERFVNKVNAEGKGLVHIRYLGGGGKVMSPFEVGNAVRTGVVDVANTTSAFYTNFLPEADALKLTQRTIQELRKNGGWEFLNQLHNQKLNAYYLAHQGDGIPFHLYLTKKIDGPSLTGLKIRVTPVYRAFFQDLGATVVQTAPGEVYTALERGIVDGYGWPIQGVLDLGWQEVTKYRVDPGFYNVDVGVLVNLDTWKKLSGPQREFLQKMAEWLEGTNADNAAINVEEAAKQAKAGIQTLTLSGAQAKEYLERAQAAGWADILKASPESGAKLKTLLSR